MNKLLSPVLNNQLFDNLGKMLSGGQIYVYDAGTLTLSSVYANEGGGALANPISLNSVGRIANGQLFLDPGKLYDMEVKQGTTVLESYTNISGLLGSDSGFLGSITSDSFIGDGVTKTFTLSLTPEDSSLVSVFIDGLYLVSGTDYALSGNQIVFVSAPTSGEQIIVKTQRSIASDLPASYQRNKIVDKFTTSNGTLSYNLSKSPGSIANIIAVLNGITLVPGTDYSWNALNPTTFTLVNDPLVSDLTVFYHDILPVLNNSSDVITYSTTGQYLTTYLDNNRVINVKDFGAVGDGVTDDTLAIQNALNVVTKGSKVILRGLTIKISSLLTIASKSGFEIDGEGSTIIMANGTPVSFGYGMLLLNTCSDFTIKNLTFDANRANRTPAEVPAHSVELRSCSRFILERVTSQNAVVDGFYISATSSTNSTTFSKQGILLNCKADNCYRQGMSIINAYNLIIDGGEYSNTNGTAPQYGIDIESNPGTAVPGDSEIVVKNARFYNNVGGGVGFYSPSGGGQRNFIIDGCTFDGNQQYDVSSNCYNTRVLNSFFLNSNVTNGSVIGQIGFKSYSTTDMIGAIIGNVFVGGTGTIPCIAVDTACHDMVISNNIIKSKAGRGIVADGSRHVISNNYINTSADIGIFIGTGSDNIIQANHITGVNGRAIYSWTNAVRTQIINNTVFDVASIVAGGGAIQIDGSDCLTDYNVLTFSTSNPTAVAIRYSANNARSISNNTFINYHTTDPILFTGGAVALVRNNNSGGTANQVGVTRSLLVKTEYYTVATLPAVATYTGCRAIVTDATTTLFGSIVIGGGSNIVPVFSNGTNWVIG